MSGSHRTQVDCFGELALRRIDRKTTEHHYIHVRFHEQATREYMYTSIYMYIYREKFTIRYITFSLVLSGDRFAFVIQP